MTDQVARRLARLMSDHPTVVVHFIAAVTDDSYLYSMSSGHPEVFVNSVHEALVADLRRGVDPTADVVAGLGPA